MKFDIWHYWIIAAFFFFVLEVFIPGFILGSMGLGCLLATLGALLNLPLWVNVLLFIVGFFVGITFLKPLLKRLEKTNNVKTNADGLIGKIGKICEKIDLSSGTGRVHIDGDDWKAISSDYSNIDEGAIVEIIALESIVVTVRLVQNSEGVENKEKPVAQTLQNKKGLILSIGNKKEIVHHDEIMCIYSQEKITYLINSNEKQMVVDESLEKLEERLGNHYFFRANRQYIITSTLVKDYKSKGDGKIELTLKPLSNIPNSISVSRLKAHAFRKWMEKQLK
ncbi:MAG: LytTR family transcriptional regulator DNA-binding domain-containing protein [Prolixibacteraceae bacterium]|jgi:membrane protein implicated in regulation of membrane protease activity|nr:LytTR family transcriptional regulator DNA-binding domain-containing protein [Prolixibacteraceae bacterium]